MKGTRIASVLLVVLSACSSTKNVSLKHSDPAMVQTARFEQELADCRVSAESTSTTDGPEERAETLPAEVSEYAASLGLRGKGYVRVDSDGNPTDQLLVPPSLAMQWSRPGTAEGTHYADFRECRALADATVQASNPDNFPAYWNSFISKLSFCLKGKGYQCRGSDCR